MHSEWSTETLYEAGIEHVQQVERLYNILLHQSVNTISTGINRSIRPTHHKKSRGISC